MGIKESMNENLKTLLQEIVNLLGDLTEETAKLTERSMGDVAPDGVAYVHQGIVDARERLRVVREALSQLQ